VGFVVSKELGRAARRNLVKRRLRHIVAGRLTDLAGVDLVVRARPEAAVADYARLHIDVDRCLDNLEEGAP
jgi:ribonuclease P protein component